MWRRELRNIPENSAISDLCFNRRRIWQKCTYLHSKIQGCLASECQHDSIGPFFLNHVSDVLRCDGKVVDFIRQLVVGLYSGNIGIDKNRGDLLLFQCFECL